MNDPSLPSETKQPLMPHDEGAMRRHSPHAGGETRLRSTRKRSRSSTSRKGRRRRPLKLISLAAIGRWGIVGLTLLALVLGGTTELWEQSTLLVLGALFMLVIPPRRLPGAVPMFLSAALLILALTAFLPAAWFPSPPWRQHLAGNAQVVLPATRTPQPWLTAQACGFLFAGLAWAAYLLGQTWDRHARFRAAQVLVAGVALLAALMTAAFCLDFHLAAWTQEENRGWFPNRNQTADVLAVCGVINYALIFDALRKRRLAAYLWFVTIALIGGALVVSYSRAGILMFFGGIALWHLWPTPGARKQGAVKWATLSLAFVFVLLTGFFLIGGDTLARFEGEGRSVHDADFRLAIQKDTLRFSAQSPVLGVGLGNFESLFASTQRDSANESRAIHPESDWLWAACELGWLAPLFFLGGIAWWLRRCLPFRLRPGESLRRAAFVAAILFLLHGLVDVSGHRLGSLWVGLLLISLALPPPAPVTTVARAPYRATTWLFRGLALGVLLIAGWWIASINGAAVPPTTAEFARIETGLEDAVAAHQFEAARDLANAGLQIAPVDWHLYFQRGYAEAFMPVSLERAGADFMVARQLEAQWVKPCFDEGTTWLAANEPDLCLDAWQEAMHRARPDEIHDSYKDMLALSRDQSIVHSGLMALADDRLDLQLVATDYATPDEMKTITARFLAEYPDLRGLDLTQRGELFGDWWDHGDQSTLLAQFAAHPDWLDAGWPYLAESYARQQDFQHAWETVARYAPAPAVPTATTALSREALESAFHEQDDNAPLGVMLYLAQSKQGDTDAALGTLRALEKLKDCPKYIYYEEARLWATKQQWELAWDAWQNYRRTQGT